MKSNQLIQLAIPLVLLAACGSDGASTNTEPQTNTFILGAEPIVAKIDTDEAGGEQANQDSPSNDGTNENPILSNDTGATAEIKPSEGQSGLVEDEQHATSEITKEPYLEDNAANQNSPIVPNSETVSNLSDLENIKYLLKEGGEIPSTQVPSALVTDSAVGNFSSKLKTVASIAILSLNSKLSSGESLTITDQKCLYDYDEAEGKPLLAIRCRPSYKIDRIGVLSVQEAAFLDTNQCRESLHVGKADECKLFAVTIDVKAHSNAVISAMSRREENLTRPQLPNKIENPEIVDIGDQSQRPIPSRLPANSDGIERPELQDIVISKPDSALDQTAATENTDRSLHLGASIQYRVNGTDLVLISKDKNTAKTIVCALNVTNEMLISGDAETCDYQYQRLSERFDYIISIVSDI